MRTFNYLRPGRTGGLGEACGNLRGVGGFGEGLGEDGTFLLVGGSKVLGAYIGPTFILANLEGTLSNHPTVSYCWSPKDTRRHKRDNPQGTSDSEAASQQNRRRPTLPSIFTSSPMDCANLDKCGKTQMHIAPSCPWVCQRDSERLCFTVEKQFNGQETKHNVVLGLRCQSIEQAPVCDSIVQL